MDPSGPSPAFTSAANKAFDVAIVGGGIAGATAAVLLARAGARVALVTKNARRRERPAETCSPAALRLVRSLDLPWPGAARGTRACRGILSAWTGNDPEFFDYTLFACEPGLTIDRSAYDQELVEAARKATVSVTTAIRAPAIRRDGATWTVNAGCSIVRAPLLIDATGRSGGLAPAITSRRRFRDRLVACSLRLLRRDRSDLHADLLLLAAVRGGWWYVSQDAGAYASVVYLTDADLLRRSHAGRCAHLRIALHDARLLHDTLVMPTELDAHHVDDARTSDRLSVAGDGWMAVGDAALSVDPLSGDGLRLAMTAAAAATEALVAACSAAAAQARFSAWYAEQQAEQRRSAVSAYAPAARRFANSPFWQRRAEALQDSSERLSYTATCVGS